MLNDHTSGPSCLPTMETAYNAVMESSRLQCEKEKKEAKGKKTASVTTS